MGGGRPRALRSPTHSRRLTQPECLSSISRSDSPTPRGTGELANLMIIRTFARGGGGKPPLLTRAAIAALAVSPDGTTATGFWNRPDCLTGRTGRSPWVDHYIFTLAAESRVELELSSSARAVLLALPTALDRTACRAGQICMPTPIAQLSALTKQSEQAISRGTPLRGMGSTCTSYTP